MISVMVYANIVYVCARVGEVGWEITWLYTLRGCAYFDTPSFLMCGLQSTSMKQPKTARRYPS